VFEEVLHFSCNHMRFPHGFLLRIICLVFVRTFCVSYVLRFDCSCASSHIKWM